MNAHLLDLQEASLMCRWAADEGWNPGIHDAEIFLGSDPGGFFGVDVNGDLAGTISAVRYGNEFAFVGFFIVRPDLRGHLLGPCLAKAALKRIAGLPTGIDGVLENVGKYKRLYGFKEAWQNIRYQLSGPPAGTAADTLVPLASIPFDALLAFDRRYFPAERGQFLKLWISQRSAHALAATSADGQLEGYGVIRPCLSGWKIGPLFAASPPVAEMIFLGLCTAAGNGPVFLDVPEPNFAAVSLAQSMGMEPVFATARMFRDSPGSIDLGGVFGITTFELG